MDVGVRLGSDKIRLVLAQADQKAKAFGADLDSGPVGQRWRPLIQALRMESIPKTYTAVFAVTLVARALHEASALSVRDIKTSTSDKGYSASSIGSQLSRFAKTHSIDLRATSSQPLNNQPFTYKKRILPSPKEMVVHEKFWEAWKAFNKALDTVEASSSADAADALALLFYLSRRKKWSSNPVEAFLAAESLEEVDELLEAVAGFVNEHTDGGKTGQAFAAAVLDILYGPESVRLGKVNDPDASTVGDVHAVQDDEIWLWTEVKQKTVTDGEINGFVSKVAAQDGSRAIFCAFQNNSYPDFVQQNKVIDAAHKKGVLLDYFDTPGAFLQHYFRVAPGSSSDAAARLVAAMVSRLAEALCPQSTREAFASLLSEHGVELEEAPEA